MCSSGESLAMNMRRKQKKIFALAHLLISASLHILLHQWHGSLLPSVLHRCFEWLFLALISPFGIIALPAGLTYCCTSPHPISVAIMGFFFACNSYSWFYLLSNISQLIAPRKNIELLLMSVLLILAIFASFFVSYLYQDKKGSVSVALMASPLVFFLYCSSCIGCKISQAIKRRKQVASHDNS
jgi:hypothetical protein